MEFRKEGFDLSSSTFKEFLDVCIRLEEAELQKLLRRKIVHAKKEHDRNGKHTNKPKLRHKRRHGLGK
eukprot:11830618-Ditylum_brightwellii.AAC.1